MGSEAGKVINIGMFIVRRGKKLGKSGCCTVGKGRGYFFILKLGRHRSEGGGEKKFDDCFRRGTDAKFSTLVLELPFDNCPPMGYPAAYSSNSVPTFRRPPVSSIFENNSLP